MVPKPLQPLQRRLEDYNENSRLGLVGLLFIVAVVVGFAWWLLGLDPDPSGANRFF
jgi:hypothetical protein